MISHLNRFVAKLCNYLMFTIFNFCCLLSRKFQPVARPIPLIYSFGQSESYQVVRVDVKIIENYENTWVFVPVDNGIIEDFLFRWVYGRRRLHSLLAKGGGGVFPNKHSR